MHIDEINLDTFKLVTKLTVGITTALLVEKDGLQYTFTQIGKKLFRDNILYTGEPTLFDYHNYIIRQKNLASDRALSALEYEKKHLATISTKFKEAFGFDAIEPKISIGYNSCVILTVQNLEFYFTKFRPSTSKAFYDSCNEFKASIGVDHFMLPTIKNLAEAIVKTSNFNSAISFSQAVGNIAERLKAYFTEGDTKYLHKLNTLCDRYDLDSPLLTQIL